MERDLSKLHKGTDGFYYDDYVQPDKPEVFIGRLVSTVWWNKRKRNALICNFETEDGRKIALLAFQKETGLYGPRYGNVNFKQAETDTLWKCEIKMTRTGHCTWASAEPIEKEAK